MSKPITLQRRNVKVSYDDACTTIASYSLPRHIPGPYDSQKLQDDTRPLTYIPSLQSLCIRQLIPFPDQIHAVGVFSLPYEAPQTPQERDILRELIPEFLYARQTRDTSFLKYVDPRLWAVLVQVYTGLPEVFRAYNIPLSDIHVPILQQIPPTPRFALVTVLSLEACGEVDDNTIIEFRDLHSLAALNLGGTALSSWGVSRFSKLLRHADDQAYNDGRRLLGPWELRILSLRNCMNVDDDVYKSLRLFPLLSIVDLRGTRCTPTSYRTSGFRPSEEQILFYPTSLQTSLVHLSKRLSLTKPSEPTHQFHSHPQPFYLHINTLNHKPTHHDARRTTFASMNITDDLRGQSLRGRRAVFTEAGMEDRVWTAPSETTSHQSINDMVYVATAEARREAAEASALSFYAPYSLTRTFPGRLPALADLPPDPLIGKTSSKIRPLTGLALYRPPPPWSNLESVVTSPSSSKVTSRGSAHNPAKRPRFEIDEALLGANEAKRKGQAQKAVNAIWGMVERRKSAPECGSTSKHKAGASVSGNPFLRRTPLAYPVLDEGLVEPVATREICDSAGAKATATKESLDVVEKSIFPIPPPTTKPLRPISALSVPNRPAETPKPKLKSSNTKLPKTVDNARQMKLSVFAEEAAKSSKTTSRSVRGSAGVTRGSSVGSAKTSPSTKLVGASNENDAGRSVHTKQKKERSFDWKGWSTR